MDPVSTIGVAAAVVQFLQFSLQTLSLCREIRDGTDGATQANKELEGYSQTLRDLVKELESGGTASATAGKRISKIVHDCIASSEELTNVVSEVRKAGKATSLAVARATFRALKDRRRIEKLRNRLEQQQKLLDTALLYDIRQRVDLVGLERSAQFETLNTASKDLLARLLTGAATASQRHADIQHSVLIIESQTQQLQQDRATRSGQTEIRQDVARLRSDISAEIEGFMFQDAREELLKSMFYPDLDSRKDMLKPPWESTFDWIFDKNLPDHANHLRFNSSPAWSSFPQWLTSDSSTYWISGRAGSGKSTLMLHIADDERTRAHLGTWAGQCRLHIFTFFFWRPGSQMQKSIRGLLRSLLYQALDSIEGVADALMTEHSLAPGRLPDWTEKRLVGMIRTVLSFIQEERLCLFLDGLDEFEGEADDLLGLLQEVHQYQHVKLCLSSRPEPRLTAHLSQFQRLRLELFNGSAIKAYARDKLTVVKHGLRYAEQIEYQAEGIFLWAILVVQSLLRGFHAGDDEQLMTRRLAQLPSEVDDLFRHMLAGVDKIHLKTLWTFLQIMRYSTERNVALFTAAMLPHDIKSYCTFADQCARTAKQITAQSRGLLEVDMGGAAYAASDNQMWLATHLQDDHCPDVSSCQFHDRRSVASSIRLVAAGKSGELVRQWKQRDVRWIHRSALDFITSIDVRSLLNIDDNPGGIETRLSLSNGHLRLGVAGLYMTETLSAEDEHTEQIIEHMRSVLGPDVTLTTASSRRGYGVLHDLRNLSIVLQGVIYQWQAGPMKLDKEDVEFRARRLHNNEIHFWETACSYGLYGYVMHDCTDIAQRDHTGVVLIHIIGTLCDVFPSYWRQNTKLDHTEPFFTCLLRLLQGLQDACAVDLSTLSASIQEESLTRRASPYAGRASRCDVTWTHTTSAGRSVLFGVKMVKAWVQICDCITAADGLTRLSAQVLQIVASFMAIFRSRDTHLGTTINLDPGRLSFQASASAILHDRLQHHCNGAILEQLTEAGLDLKPTYRVVCQRRARRTTHDRLTKTSSNVEAREEVVYHISNSLGAQVSSREFVRSETSQRYLDESGYIDPEWLLRCDAFHDALTAEIWKDKEGQLTAWQQLCVLTCLRIARRRKIVSTGMFSGYLSDKQAAMAMAGGNK